MSLVVQTFAALSQAVVLSCLGASANGPEPSAYNTLETPIHLCSINGQLEMGEAKKLRDELTLRSLHGKSQLLGVSKSLEEAEGDCASRLDMPNAQFFGTLYALLGMEYLSENDTLNARRTFGAGNAFFSSHVAPSLAWLETLQGEARADVQLGNLSAAAETAFKETQLARSWVDEQGFVLSALTRALRFEAEIEQAAGHLGRAKELMREAAERESRK